MCTLSSLGNVRAGMRLFRSSEWYWSRSLRQILSDLCFPTTSPDFASKADMTIWRIPLYWTERHPNTTYIPSRSIDVVSQLPFSPMSTIRYYVDARIWRKPCCLRWKALKLRPAWYPRPLFLDSLSSALVIRFEQLSRREDLDGATVFHWGVVELLSASET